MACSEEYKPSKNSLKSSLRSRVKEYPRVAALHGISYVADHTRPKAERIGWCICIVASTVAALGIIFTLMERFQIDPMMDSLEIQFDAAPLNLPQLYICPPWKSFNHDFLPKQQYDRQLYELLYNWDFARVTPNRTYPNDLDNAGVNLKKLFTENAPSCEQFIQNFTLISVGEKQIGCSDFELAVTSVGICFISPSVGRIIDETPSAFIFAITTFPTRVYASLEKDTLLLRHIELFLFRFPSALTIELQETYTASTAQMLTRSQRKCFFSGEQSPYTKCVLDCKIANSLEFCGCVPWYLSTDGIKECRINEYECLERHSLEITDVVKCHCRLPCDNIVLRNIELQTLADNELCKINLRRRSPFKYKRTVRFGWADLLVSFGGIAGLFVGCSLLSIIEFGYYFTLRTYCGAVLSLPKRRHNVIKINVLDVSQPVNPTWNRKRPDDSKKRVNFYDYVN